MIKPKAAGAKKAYAKHEKSEPKKVEKMEHREQSDLQKAVSDRNSMYQKMFKGEKKK